LQLPDIAAAVFLLLMAALPLLVAVQNMRRSRLSPFQCLLWVIAYLMCKVQWRTRWLTPLTVSDHIGAVIVCNHRSSVDPFFIQMLTGRKVHWMVAREYCHHPALRWFLGSCEVIPVSRGGVDTASTKAAIRICAGGGLVGMLPEGRINMTAAFMLPARPGAILVALKARVPIVPCYIKGSPYWRYTWSPLVSRARVEVRCGAPIDLSEYYGREHEPGIIQEAARRVLRSIADLAGRQDYEPQIAGRSWKPTQQELHAMMEEADRRT
jgi:1-acyl-sn-glycerol-3-phosphate acyltransferase